MIIFPYQSKHRSRPRFSACVSSPALPLSLLRVFKALVTGLPPVAACTKKSAAFIESQTQKIAAVSVVWCVEVVVAVTPYLKLHWRSSSSDTIPRPLPDFLFARKLARINDVSERDETQTSMTTSAQEKNEAPAHHWAADMLGVETKLHRSGGQKACHSDGTDT